MRLSPAHLLPPVAAAVSLLGATSPIDDVNDAFWHVVVGREVRTQRSATGVGDSWAWYDPPEPWTTSQWLAEVVMSWAVDIFGWSALIILTLGLSSLILASLWWVIRRRADPWVSALLFSAVALPLGLSFQNRPGLISMLGAVWIGHIADGVLRKGRLPRWWLVPIVVVWANLHGGWVIAPAVIGLAVALRWMSAPRDHWPFALRGSLLTVSLLAAGCVTPLGVAGLLLPFQLRASTQNIGEWQATALANGFALPLVVTLTSIVVAWARSSTKIPMAEIAFVVAVAAFGLLAYRNVAIAALLLAATVAGRLGTTFVRRVRETSPTEQQLLRVSIVFVTAMGTAWVTVTMVATDPLEDVGPLAIAEALAQEPGPLRVLNHYNASGPLVAFGPPGIELGIDGRAERYGQEYVDDYLDVFALSGDHWQRFVEAFDPHAAVARQDQAIVHYLTDDLGWRVVVTEGDWMLLRP